MVHVYHGMLSAKEKRYGRILVMLPQPSVVLGNFTLSFMLFYIVEIFTISIYYLEKTGSFPFKSC